MRPRFRPPGPGAGTAPAGSAFDSKKRRAEMTTLLKCLACGEIQELADGRTVCKCGRSAARLDGAIVEVQGPARVLVPADDVMTVDGIPWTAMPEEPVVVRRAA